MLISDPIQRWGEVIIVLIYVDDILSICKSLSNPEFLQRKLTGTFGVKNLGEAHYCLIIEISQETYKYISKRLRPGYTETWQHE